MVCSLLKFQFTYSSLVSWCPISFKMWFFKKIYFFLVVVVGPVDFCYLLHPVRKWKFFSRFPFGFSVNPVRSPANNNIFTSFSVYMLFLILLTGNSSTVLYRSHSRRLCFFSDLSRIAFSILLSSCLVFAHLDTLYPIKEVPFYF